jgi:3-dehydroquinate dehydratase type I
MVKICVPITEANVKDAVEAMKKAKELGADLVEVRMDYLGGTPDEAAIGELMEAVDIPKIATLRPKSQGGFYEGSESNRINALQTAMSFGAAYIDLEVSTDVGWRYEIGKACKSNGSKLIVSFHDFKGTPKRDDLIDMIKNEFAAGAQIAKIATTPQSFDDVMTVMSVISLFKTQGRDVIGVAMGKLGAASRLLAGPAGSYLTYASLSDGKESAEGQIPIEDMKKILKLIK